MNGKFYIVVDHGSPNAFIGTVDSVPRVFDTEDEATAAAKDYTGQTLVLKSVALVTEKITYKVERFK